LRQAGISIGARKKGPYCERVHSCRKQHVVDVSGSPKYNERDAAKLGRYDAANCCSRKCSLRQEKYDDRPKQIELLFNRERPKMSRPGPGGDPAVHRDVHVEEVRPIPELKTS